LAATTRSLAQHATRLHSWTNQAGDFRHGGYTFFDFSVGAERRLNAGDVISPPTIAVAIGTELGIC